MSEIRSEILNTGIAELKSARIVINAPAAKIFDIIARPALHPKIDGTNSVKSVNWGPDRLSLEAKFGMRMKIGIRYKITNIVVEFQDNQLIAWRHLGRWVWRYELRELSSNQTEVTESFDGRPSPLQWWLKARGSYSYVEKALAKTLVRLKKYAENGN
ncbi:MAG: polyketide cyclase / dehydrase and lipid transport [Actinobacteria bacterium]|nr:polyketide cyclase / dehydrase and lipid transport [Actinomycetota bacterium]